MLRELHISNLAVIEDLAVEFGPGLNCFTGQTGAGKSLVLGALEILLGLRSGNLQDMIRPGAAEARVAGIFELRDAVLAEQISRACDLTLAPGEDILLTRKLFASGRTSLSLNGQPATAGMVRRVAELLIDVHGQHDHQFLLKPSNQLTILDAFAGCETPARDFGKLHAELRDLENRQRDLNASRTLRRQQLELYEFQAGEIDQAQPREGEYAELKARHALLANLQRIKKDAGGAYAALYDSEGAVLERLHMITHVLGDLALLDPQLKDTADAIRNATAGLQDGAFELQRYVDRLELDPAEHAEVEDRLNVLHRLASKYADQATPGTVTTGNDPIAAVLAYRAQIENEISTLRAQNEDLQSLADAIARLQNQLQSLGQTLTRDRQAAAARLRPLIEKELHDLGMPEARFEVEFAANGQIPATTTGESDAPPEIDSRTSPTGYDHIEMMVRTNPGQPVRPLRKIASGGELSRIMLALKAILAQNDRISVLVFDEIDANIGGRMGTVIGGKLRKLAHGPTPIAPAKRKSPKTKTNATHSLPEKLPGAIPGAGAIPGGQQILCITHLPQIAAYADRHFRIAKAVTGKGAAKQTHTQVTVLDGSARIEELAEMLAGSGASDTSRQQAREMLDLAHA